MTVPGRISVKLTILIYLAKKFLIHAGIAVVAAVNPEM
jgi:hypothetical protein